jgi:hypothetical protein
MKGTEPLMQEKEPMTLKKCLQGGNSMMTRN